MRKLLFLAVLALVTPIYAQQTQVASDTLQNAACSSSCGSGGQLGANWDQNSGNNITESATGVKGGFSANGYDYRNQAYWVGTGSFGNDMYSQASCTNITNQSASMLCGVSVRMTGSLSSQSNATGYMFFIKSDAAFDGKGTYYLYKSSGGSGTLIDSSTVVVIPSPVVINLQVIGSTLTATAGGTTIFTDTDSSITTGGKPGVLIGNGAGSQFLSAWSGGTASSQPTVANPTSSLATGTYAMPQTVTLNVSTTGATICETTDGSTPTTPATPDGTCTNGTAKSDGDALTISATTTLKLLGTKTGDVNSSVVTYIYTQAQVANPTATNGTNTYYTDPVSETLSDGTSGATIVYCVSYLNSCTPSTTYSGAFNVSPEASSTGGIEYVRAKATKTGYLDSSTVTFTYSFQVSSLSASPVAGTYTSAQSVTLSIATTTGASIFYNLTGSPTCASTPYTAPIAVNLSETIYAVGCKTNYANSSVLTAAYVIQVVASPTASPVAGGYFTSQTVTLSDSTGSSTILYCQDTNNTCTPVSTYSSPLTQSATGYIRAQGTKSGWGSSAVVSFYYLINPPDQTGAYQFTDNFQNYESPIAKDTEQLPLDSWNTSGLWTANGTVSITSSVTTVLNNILGGGSVELYKGNPTGGNPAWATYTGATGFAAAGQGQYSSASVQWNNPAAVDWYASKSYLAGAQIQPSLYNDASHYYQAVGACISGTIEPNPWNQTSGGTSNDNGGSGGCTWKNVSGSLTPSPAPCVLTFSDASGGLTGYSLCLSTSGTASLSKNTSGGSIATSSVGACLNAATIELRTLNGVNQPLCGGSTPAGMAANYTDGTPLTTGNPGVAGSALYNWVGGTIGASSAPSVTSYTHTYATYSPTDANHSTWPFFEIGVASALPARTLSSAVNTGISSSAGVTTVNSTLNPGVGSSVYISGVLAQGVTYGAIGPVTVTASNSSSYQYSGTFTPSPINSGLNEIGSIIYASFSGLAASVGGIVYIVGASPSGFNGPCTVLSANGSSSLTCTNGNTGLGTASIAGSIYAAGESALLSPTLTSIGADHTSGIAQNLYMAPFAPSQWILVQWDLDTTDTRLQNAFIKLESNSAVPGGAGCYDAVAYYLGVEPQWPQNGGIPPYPLACNGTLEYCGTEFLHITKDTPQTSVDPGGGCAAHPNYNVVTVSGSSYIPMRGDSILFMYDMAGYLSAYCKGSANSANAPFGDGCPTTSTYTRVIYALDTDMQAVNAVGLSQGFPGLWFNAPNVTTPVLHGVSMGSVTSGVTCQSITGVSCNIAIPYVPMSMIP